MQKLLLLALADHANDETFDCWPSLTHLCKKTGMGRSTVARTLLAMESAQLIGREQRENQSTRYVLNVSRWSQSGTSATAGLVPQRDGVVPQRDGGSARAGHSLVPERDHKHQSNHQGTITEPSITCAMPAEADLTPDTSAELFQPPPKADGKPEYPAEFEATWAAYPKRAGGNSKTTALKAWKARRRLGVSAADMHAGVLRYAVYIAASGKSGSEFVMQAARFFGPGDHWREAWVNTHAGDTHFAERAVI